MKSFEGYLKQTAGDTYLLLAGGGIKPLSDFWTTTNPLASNLGNYLPRNTDSSVLPEFSSYPPYLLGIEAFSDGGTIKWKGWANCRVGYATYSTYVYSD